MFGKPTFLPRGIEKRKKICMGQIVVIGKKSWLDRIRRRPARGFFACVGILIHRNLNLREKGRPLNNSLVQDFHILFHNTKFVCALAIQVPSKPRDKEQIRKSERANWQIYGQIRGSGLTQGSVHVAWDSIPTDTLTIVYRARPWVPGTKYPRSSNV